MDIDRLNEQDASIQAHALRAIRAAKQQKLDRREVRAQVQEALTQRDNMRGDMLRAFLKTK